MLEKSSENRKEARQLSGYGKRKSLKLRLSGQRAAVFLSLSLSLLLLTGCGSLRSQSAESAAEAVSPVSSSLSEPETFGDARAQTGAGASGEEQTPVPEQQVIPEPEGLQSSMESPEAAAQGAESSAEAPDSSAESTENTENAENAEQSKDCPATLAEVLGAGPKVMMDGREIPSVSAGGVTLVRDTDLLGSSEILARELSGSDETPTYTRQNGSEYPVEWTFTSGSDLSYPGSGGICCTCSDGTREYWLPLRDAVEASGMEILWDEETGTAFVYTPLDTDLVPQSGNVPVLMYHEVSDNTFGAVSLFVSPSDMRTQLQYLKDNGYDTIFFSDLTHLEDYDKPVLLTYDDGYSGNYEYLLPLLREFGMKATVFAITGLLDTENYMTTDQLRELSASGLVEVESHTVDHEDLSQCTDEDLEYQLSRSRLEIARITGKVPYVLAYPSGYHTAATISAAEQYYDFAVIMGGDRWYLGSSSLYEIPRYYVSRYTTISEFAVKVK